MDEKGPSEQSIRMGAHMKRYGDLDERLEEAERVARLLRARDRAEYQALRRRRVAGEVAEPYPGLFCRIDPSARPDKRTNARRVLRTLAAEHPAWAFCSFSAAVAHGLQVPHECLSPVRIIAAPGTTRRSGGALRRHLLRAESSIVDGIRATGIDQTVLDCLRHGTFSQGLAVADSALHWELTTKDALTEHFAAAGAGIGGIRGARRALAHADGRAENGGESLARAIMIERGFSVPELQVHVEDPVEPGALRRVDFLWRLPNGKKIICELDGLGKYLPEGTDGCAVEHAVRELSRERVRESHLNLTGATVVRLASSDLSDPDHVAHILEIAGVPPAGSA